MSTPQQQLRSPNRTASTGVVWFKPTDLRLDDHEPLVVAHKECNSVIHCFVFDDHPTRGVMPTSTSKHYGNQRVGARRFKWLVEAVADLRNRLEAQGSSLIVRVGRPRTMLAELVHTVDNVKCIYTHDEVYSEEVSVMTLVSAGVPCQVRKFWGGQTLVHWDDCPYETMTSFPNMYTQFRSKIESRVNNGREKAISRYMTAPTTLKPPPTHVVLTAGDIPVIDVISTTMDVRVDVTSTTMDARTAVPFVGGETAALQRLHYYFDKQLPTTYKDTRNEMLGADYSTKFSLWLATGSISARRIVKDLDTYETTVTSNKSTYWIWFELLWRDFFRFQAMKQGTSMFHIYGPQKNTTKTWRRDQQHFELWTQGRTGHPLVDANMIELKTTGFMSNRGRQIVASFLTNDMQLDWRMGAAHFEEHLIDYECGANWGNWSYAAGVGCDPREDRYFSIPKQGNTYDSKAEYIKAWLPLLSKCSPSQLLQSKVEGVDPTVYPNPPAVKLKFNGTNTKWNRLRNSNSNSNTHNNSNSNSNNSNSNSNTRNNSNSNHITHNNSNSDSNSSTRDNCTTIKHTVTSDNNSIIDHPIRANKTSTSSKNSSHNKSTAKNSNRSNSDTSRSSKNSNGNGSSSNITESNSSSNTTHPTHSTEQTKSTQRKRRVQGSWAT